MKIFIRLIISLLIFGNIPAFAKSYADFASEIESENQLRRNDGLGLMISGGIALIGGGVGFSHADKTVEKGFYSIAQSLGLLAIGYGAEAYFLKQNDEIFLQVLNSVELTESQKNRMVESYLKEKREREEDTAWIRRTTFGLAGALNVMYAAQTKDESLKNFLYVTAGLQFVWAFTF